MSMSTSTFELARKTAHTAIPYTDDLASAFFELGRAMRDGEVELALADLGPVLDRFQRFLTFLDVSAGLMKTSAPTVAHYVQDYYQRLLGLLDNLQQALEDRDLVASALVLQHSIVEGLREYRSYASDVSFAFNPSRCA